MLGFFAAVTLLPGCINDDVPQPISHLLYQTPADFPPMPMPTDNPPSEAGIRLGRMLFYDPILSGDSSLSCGGCHNQSFAFTDDGKRWSEGITGDIGDFNSMQLVNLGWGKNFFWDGRSSTLELQALEPVENPVEMHEIWPNAVAKLQRHPDYPNLFKLAFGTQEITKEKAAMAIAQFERSLISTNSLYHEVERGIPGAQFTAQEQLGYELFFNEKG
ncbi:MAG: cytochrome-c peroxidase, partial [Bacteroidota bacterium]